MAWGNAFGQSLEVHPNHFITLDEWAPDLPQVHIVCNCLATESREVVESAKEL
jgi:hypothetical protein